ncbi:MAG: 4-hydroxyproline epimerase [Pseudomonadota bacterium]
MRHVFQCLDGHTAGNPVRLVSGGAPMVRGETMSFRRADFVERFDWIRQSLCFEPRGHDMMSGGFLYPPLSEGADCAILFMETSGCLPMCGHGLIGLLTFSLEAGLVQPRKPGQLSVETPAGLIDISFKKDGDKVTSIKFRNIPSYLAARNIKVTVPELGELSIDVAYGGNFYAIIEPQGCYSGVDNLGVDGILRLSPMIRNIVRQVIEPVHPKDPSIRGVSHILWVDHDFSSNADGRNAVFYGDKAIDRSPCGTGTSARMAQLCAHGRLKKGDSFRHESFIKSCFSGRVEENTRVGDFDAIVPSIEGTAYLTGYNTIIVDDKDPYWSGFQVV